MTLLLVKTKQNTIRSRRVVSRILVKSSTGPQGRAATVSVGNTTTLPEGSQATVQNTGTAVDAILNFGIPKGDKGDQGDQGEQGINTWGSIEGDLSDQTDLQAVLDTKVDREAGKGLSTNDYTTAEKDKLADIATGATANETDAYLLNRANHTGTQEISTVSGLQTILDSKATTTALTAHTSNTSNPHGVTKAQVGLGNVDNTSDLNKPISNPTQVALNSKADLVDGKVPESQLPSFVDDVLTFDNLASFPTTGEDGKIYITRDTNLTYRWTGTGYTEISASLALGETSSTAYRGDRGKVAYDHTLLTNNPHGVTKAQVGLANADDTSDLNKPISTATQTALDGKATRLSIPQFSLAVRAGAGSGEPDATRTWSIGLAASTFAFRGTDGTLIAAAPTANDHLTTKLYVDNAITGLGSVYLPLTGGTLTGNIMAPSFVVSNTSGGLYSNTNAGQLRVFGGMNNNGAGIILTGSTNGFPDRGLIRVGSTNIAQWNSNGLSMGGIDATHSFTLPSISTGIAAYNTADQTTNYERVRQFWSANAYNIAAEFGGSGTRREIWLGNDAYRLVLTAGSTSGMIRIVTATPVSTASAVGLVVRPSYTGSTGVQYGQSIEPQISQSSTAGYTALLINPTETSTGSGVKNLIDAQVGGISQFAVSNTGRITATSVLDLMATSPAIYFTPPTGSQTEIRTTSGGVMYFVNRTLGNYIGAISSTGLALFNSSSALSATHTLTLPSIASGFAAYNTADQTTNYERVIRFWSGNTFFDTVERAGTGTNRAMRYGVFAAAGTRYLQSNTTGGLGFTQVFANNLTGGESAFQVSATAIGATGVHYGQRIVFSANQSGTGSYAALQIDATETATGSGAKMLIDATLGGVSRFSVDNQGNVTGNNIVNSTTTKNITVSPSQPTGMLVGDIWIVV